MSDSILNKAIPAAPGAYVDHGRIIGPCSVNWSNPLSIGLRLVVADASQKNIVENTKLNFHNVSYTEENGFVFDNKDGHRAYIGAYLDDSCMSEVTCVLVIPPVNPKSGNIVLCSIGRNKKTFYDSLIFTLNKTNLKLVKLEGGKETVQASADVYIHARHSYSVVAFTYSALGKCKIYIDGKKIAESSGGFSPLNYGTEIAIGGTNRMSSDGPSLDSMILYMHYDRVLTHDELMMIGKKPFSPIFKSWYDKEEKDQK